MNAPRSTAAAMQPFLTTSLANLFMSSPGCGSKTSWIVAALDGQTSRFVRGSLKMRSSRAFLAALAWRAKGTWQNLDPEKNRSSSV
jgi:hypothetical protein